MKRGNKKTRMQSELSYDGPVRATGLNTRVRILSSVPPTTVTSDASGVTAVAITTNFASTTQDWSSYSTIFTEYRVLALLVRYQPFTPFGASNYSTGNVVSVHDTALSTPGSAASIAAVPDRKFINFGRPWQMEWRMNGVDEAGFLQTSGTAIQGGIAWYCTNGAASTAFGSYVVDVLMEFRGQR